MADSSVSKRLRTRQTMFIWIAALLAAFILYEIVVSVVPWYYALGAYIIGIPLGYLLGRAMKIRWHETDEQAISENDIIGTIALVLYVLFALSREWILGQWFAAALVLPLSLALASGLLLGRYFGIQRSINRVLGEQGKA
jgi:hypothetical protein